MFVTGAFEFNYYGSNTNESEKEIIVKDNALLDITGESRFHISTGEDFNLGTYNMAKTIFRDSLSVLLTGTGKEAAITLHDASEVQILSSAYLFNSSVNSNDFAKLRVREESSNLYIAGNVYLESQGASVKLEAEGDDGVITVAGDIIMNASAQNEAIINIIEDGKIFLGGTIIRQNVFGKLIMEDDGALILNGSIPQSIPQGKLPNSGTDSLFFKNIKLENTSSATMTLSENLIVKDELILTTGNLKTDAAAMVILKEGAMISGSSAAYVEGPVRKLGNTGGQPFTFPVGTSDAYAPITISPVASAGSEVTVEYLSEPPPFG